MLFRDREDAGRQLSRRLERYREDPDAGVLGIPRGGIVVGAAIARELHRPLGVCAVHKLGAPGNPELAIGAVDDEGATIVDWSLLRRLEVTDQALEVEVERQRREIIVDDGIATGATARAAVQATRRRGARRLILAVPVAPAETARALEALVDEWVCLATPEPFFAVGNFFEEWPQVTDEEVRSLLEAAAP